MARKRKMLGENLDEMSWTETEPRLLCISLDASQFSIYMKLSWHSHSLFRRKNEWLVYFTNYFCRKTLLLATSTEEVGRRAWQKRRCSVKKAGSLRKLRSFLSRLKQTTFCLSSWSRFLRINLRGTCFTVNLGDPMLQRFVSGTRFCFPITCKVR